jgi:hypothetical protein
MPSTQVSRSRMLAVSTALLALLTSGCGSDDSDLESSNRGSGSDTTATTVENAYIVPAFVPGRCAIQLELGAELRFTVTNGRPTDSERLLGLSTDAGRQAQPFPVVDIPPESSVGVGLASAESVDAGGRIPGIRLEALDRGLRPAMSTDVTFQFERAGDIPIRVPVEACPVQTQ